MVSPGWRTPERWGRNHRRGGFPNAESKTAVPACVRVCLAAEQKCRVWVSGSPGLAWLISLRSRSSLADPRKSGCSSSLPCGLPHSRPRRCACVITELGVEPTCALRGLSRSAAPGCPGRPSSPPTMITTTSIPCEALNVSQQPGRALADRGHALGSRIGRNPVSPPLQGVHAQGVC